MEVPLENCDVRVSMELQYLMWPHELFSAIYHYYKTGWTEYVCPSVRAIEAFWDSQAGNPQLDSDDIRSRPDFRSRCIPIALRGEDGVPVTGLGKSWSKDDGRLELEFIVGARRDVTVPLLHLWYLPETRVQTTWT